MAGRRKSSGRLSPLLEGLNPEQREAVVSLDGPVLILAGAGSGKTRVLTHRVAYLIEQGKAAPYQILAVTFTNKAAGEMRERIERLVGPRQGGLWIGTFHSICARILRQEADRIGYSRNFVIYDADDQLAFIRNTMAELNISTKQFNPNAVRARICGAKNAYVAPEEYSRLAADFFEEKVAQIYTAYQRRLQENNAMDFDDLLIKPIQLFDQYPQVLASYQERFRYILVDEYQDTNRAQYLLVKMLAQRHRNLCVVGDDDQSIYAWRGADLRNILDFEKDYPDCRIFRLEQNYRSTRFILDAAHSVVSNNESRREKQLWTDKEHGEKVTVLEVGSDLDEAEAVVHKIREQFARYKRNFRDFAVLYRTNAQSRILEDALRRHGIAYVIVGGLRFYERKEIKDVLAYLRLVSNPADSISLMRVINYPPRGIGATTLGRLNEFALREGIPLFEALGRVAEVEGVSERIRESVLEFHSLITKYASLKEMLSAAELANALIDEIGILRTFKEVGTEESLNRAENVRELLRALSEPTPDGEVRNLERFLEEVALVTDIDTWDDRANAVTLMTLHAAKGLEFPVVFITGLEEGLFPLSRTFTDPKELEEERRLLYVGATRAKEKLYLCWARQRRRFGENSMAGMPSRFLQELDPSAVEEESFYRSHTSYRPRRPRSVPTGPEAQPMPAYEDFSQEVVELRVGALVRHPKFGTGTVISRDGHGENLKVTVDFPEAGHKRLMVKYANLELVA
jgi:DNA helicase-2/ATP-dependent DNA helicase PcrA